jgi:[NiFe] hydrogenase diaphorase moiety large subunit
MEKHRIRSFVDKKLTFRTIDPDHGLKAAIGLSPEQVIEVVTASQLKGRGGAGFPTGAKWKFCRGAVGEQKYVVCNADEGEPGTFKDRVILTRFPHLVFAGMTIAARAVGATKGIVYLRGEYTYLRGGLEAALQERRDSGLLGDRVMDSDQAFDIEIRMGAGAYVCGEETALIESLEGHRGESRNRPPFTADTGMNADPTVVNNVETFAWAACILDKGPEWFRVVGTDMSTGYKLFSVSGDIDRPGVYELPLGITVQELLEAVGGENAKAVVIGGAAGRCVGQSEFDRKVCYEDVPTGGAVIVFGPGRDMLEVAENFLEFMCEESCGQCTPCRVGNPKLLECVRMLQDGKCSASYLREIVSLGESIHAASKCGLGQSSGNVFLSIVEHFREEIMGRAVGAV